MKKINVRAAAVAALILFLAVAGCTSAMGQGPEGEKTMTKRKILPVLERHINKLMAIPGVTGVAEGRCDGRPCIKVYITAKTPQTANKIPAEIEGFTVSVEETGEFRPLPRNTR